MDIQEKKPIILLLGPSGSGKSNTGNWLREDLDFLHYDIDRRDGQDGINYHDLRAQWNRFHDNFHAEDLAIEMRRRIDAENKQGAILTFSSLLVLSKEHIDNALLYGILVLVMYGTGSDCLKAFLKRERDLRSPLDGNIEHWICNNVWSYPRLSKPEYDTTRIMNFSNGEFRSRAEIVADIVRLIHTL